MSPAAHPAQRTLQHRLDQLYRRSLPAPAIKLDSGCSNPRYRAGRPEGRPVAA